MHKTFLKYISLTLGTSLLFGSVALADGQCRVGSLKGPTSMGLVNFMHDEETDDDPEYTFSMVTAADELVAQFSSDQVDIALLPANVASVLYNKTNGNVQVIDINTLGVLYLVTADDSISSVADLKGKTIYTTGKGQTPEYTLNYLLAANDLTADDVTIEFKSEATEVVSVLSQDPTAIGLLPQPFATVACQQNESLQMVCDLTSEWDAVGNGTLVTGVTVAKKSFIEANPECIDEFLDEHEDSAEDAIEDVEGTAELVSSYGIIEKAPVAAKALPKCNITYLDNEEMKTALSGYLQALYDQNPESVGGELPGDDFYYFNQED